MNRIKIKFSCLIIINAILLSCVFLLVKKAETRESYKAGNVKIAIVRMNKNDFKFLGNKLDHPARLTVESIEHALSGLYYEEKTPFSWAKKKNIFLKDNLRYMASLIQKAFLKLKPHTKILFSILVNSSRQTSGSIYVRNNALIFKFKTIHGMEYIDDSSVKAETEADILTNWRLAPGANQQFFIHKGLLGIRKRERTMITVKVNPGKAAKPLKERKGIAANEEGPAEAYNNSRGNDYADRKKNIEKKLRFLNKLKKDKLISEDAFEKKVQELLDLL